MNGLTNLYLEKLCRKFIGSNFIGVYPSDTDPDTKRKKFSIIFNLSPHYEEGSHFISVLKLDDLIYYFDSFGKPPKNLHINNFMKKFQLPIIYSKIKLQDDKSSFCGFFCFYFLFFILNMGRPINEFYHLFFSESLEKNDSLLINLMCDSVKK